MSLIKVNLLRTSTADQHANATVTKLARRSRAATDATLDEVGGLAKASLEELTNNWNSRPAFKLLRTLNTVSVVTTSKVFGWVDRGTRPHEIRAKPGKTLSFKLGYRPKTAANSATFRGPGSASGKRVYAKSVMHPGTKARNYTIFVKNKTDKEGLKLFKQQVKLHMDDNQP